jgi:ABC-type transport system involved in multi-copper enzyme maturation permease subunit
MKLPTAYFFFRCLITDTFRQALAARTFWLMLAVSILCIGLCLSIHIEGGASLKPPGEIELIGPDQKPLTGPNPHPGTISVLFGAIRLPLFRDAEAQVHFLEAFLALWVAGAAGTLAALIWTAGFVPAFLDPATAPVLLAKPVPRPLLLVGKCVGVLCFVFFQEAVFFVGTWLALGFRTGIWSPGYLICLPLMLLQFFILYQFSVLVAVVTRSTVAAIFGSLVCWLLCFAVNLGRYVVALAPQFHADPSLYSSQLTRLADWGYWLLPKPADLLVLLDTELAAGEHFDALAPILRQAQQQGLIASEWSVATSLVFGIVILGLAAREFTVLDY